MPAWRADDVGHVVFGHVINTEPRDMYLARVAAIEGGCAQETPALTVNRLCGSGLQAIVTAAQCILLGDAEVAIGGGAESMSRAPYSLPHDPLGRAHGPHQAGRHDARRAARSLPQHPHGRHGRERGRRNTTSRASSRIRQRLKATSARSAPSRPATSRSRSCRWRSKAAKARSLFDTDEHVRGDAKLEDMAKLKPAFQKENGTVTAGNASGLNDAAAAVVLMEARRGRAARA